MLLNKLIVLMDWNTWTKDNNHFPQLWAMIHSLNTTKILKIGTYSNNCNCPNNGTVGFYNTVMVPKDSNELAYSVDPNQTAPRRSNLIRVYTVCTHFSVPLFRIFMVALSRL